ncbi:MAG: efflux RND transporter periplasmic adaptor subunit [Nitrospira sp.]|nr:efflux RND transporter periplasmic adaptor subunit [Nitrospira sp.]
MRHPWCIRGMVTVLLVTMAIMPSTGWSKGEQGGAALRSDHGVARGIVKAAAQAMLYAQVQGRVSQLPYREGQRFGKGHTLVQIDCDKYRAELAVAQAEHESKDKVYKNNLELGKLNAVSKLDLETSAADVKKASASVRVAEISVKGCQIVAPFGGRVVTVMVNEHENVFPNDKLISLLDDSSLEIELVLPSASLAWLKRKSPFSFVVDETRRSYPAKVKEIGASVDAASQTVKVIGAFEKLPPEILAGMSGTAQFGEQP